MRIGLLSDVHANLFALRSAISRLRAEGVDAWVCAGDLVGYGPHPNECVETIAELGATCVVGNHELMMLDELPDTRAGGWPGAASCGRARSCGPTSARTWPPCRAPPIPPACSSRTARRATPRSTSARTSAPRSCSGRSRPSACSCWDTPIGRGCTRRPAGPCIPATPRELRVPAAPPARGGCAVPGQPGCGRPVAPAGGRAEGPVRPGRPRPSAGVFLRRALRRRGDPGRAADPRASPRYGPHPARPGGRDDAPRTSRAGSGDRTPARLTDPSADDVRRRIS